MKFAEAQRIALLVGLFICAYLLIHAWNDDYGQKSGPAELAGSVGETQITDQIDQLDVASGREEQRQESLIDQVDSQQQSNDADIPDASVVRPLEIRAADTFDDGGEVALVKTPLMRVKLDLRGGDLVQLGLLKYPLSIEDPNIPVTLLDKRGGYTYVAQSGLVGRDGVDQDEQRPLYRVSKKSWTIDDQPAEITLTYDRSDGLRIDKIFRFQPDSYVIEVRYEIRNRTQQPFLVNLFAQLKRDSSKAVESSSALLAVRPYLGAALTTNDSRYEKISFEDIEESDYLQEINGGWIAIIQHYFLTAWVTDTSEPYTYYGKRSSNGLNRFGWIGPEVRIGAGQNGELSTRFYAGPKDQSVLQEISPNLHLTVDYGIFWWLSVPLFTILDFLQSYVANWGVAIILLTILIKLVMYPLSATSYRAMARMRKVAPQMKRIQERYAGDPPKQRQAMMELYKKEKVNPLKGCLPIFLQMPVFIALYWVLYESVELRQAPFFGWISDLAAMDPYFVLPILMGASMYGMNLLSPQMPDPMQQKMMKMMPIIFTVLFIWFPSGLVLYWLVNNVLSFLQQWYETKRAEKTATA